MDRKLNLTNITKDMEGEEATEGSRQDSEQKAAVAWQHRAKPTVLSATATKGIEGLVQIRLGPFD